MMLTFRDSPSSATHWGACWLRVRRRLNRGFAPALRNRRRSMWGTPLERSGRRRSDGGAADSSKYFSALLPNIMSMYAGSITMPGGRWEFNTRMISSKPGAPIHCMVWRGNFTSRFFAFSAQRGRNRPDQQIDDLGDDAILDRNRGPGSDALLSPTLGCRELLPDERLARCSGEHFRLARRPDSPGASSWTTLRAP